MWHLTLSRRCRLLLSRRLWRRVTSYLMDRLSPLVMKDSVRPRLSSSLLSLDWKLPVFTRPRTLSHYNYRCATCINGQFRYNSIFKCDLDIRRDLYGNIVLSG